MERTILHVDCNSFYASVECFLNPAIRHFPVAVCGDVENRHGIILAKNELAKRHKVATGDAVWQAQKKCPGLVCVPARFDRYLRFSRMARAIYEDYTDRVEPFGLDECWLDLSGPGADGIRTAQEIRRRMKSEVGITVSIGVSFNKIFAKLGSDLRKPDAVTVISRDAFRQTVWPLPAEALLYVGRATSRKLLLRSIRTIGDLAQADPEFLQSFLGKMGRTLQNFAAGRDAAPVRRSVETVPVKSVGNSLTSPHDLETMQDIRILTYLLTESVAARLREYGMKSRTVRLWIRDNELCSFSRQTTLRQPSCLARDLAAAALALFEKHYDWHSPVRSMGIAAANLSFPAVEQLTFFDDPSAHKAERLENSLDDIRRRFGNPAVRRGVVLLNDSLAKTDIQAEHIIHPVSYFR